MTQYDVVGIGNAIVDVLAQVDESFLTQHNLPKGGMMLVDEARSSQIYETIPMATEVSGGSAANTLAGIASLGGKGAFIGKVKDDQLGKIFRHDLKSIGVHYDTSPSLSGPGTAQCLVAITPDAERTMATYLGATRYITPVDIDESIVKNSAVTYLEGYLWDEEEAKAAIRKAIEIAKKNKRKIALSLSDLFCVERHRADFWQLIESHVDILFCNDKELLALTQETVLEKAIAKIHQKCEVVAVTLGAEGSLVIGEKTHKVAPGKGLKVVDTTGAGDLYAAGFLYAYTRGMDLPTCGNIATISAAEVIQHIGARPQVELAGLLKRA